MTDYTYELLVREGVKDGKARGYTGMFKRISDSDLTKSRQEYLYDIRRLVENREANEGILSFLQVNNYFATINVFKNYNLLKRFSAQEPNLKVADLEEMLGREFSRPSYPDRRKANKKVDEAIAESLGIVDPILKRIELLTMAKRRGFDMEIAERIVKESV